MSQEKLIVALMKEIDTLKRRVEQLEKKEYAIMQSGAGVPAHAAAESVFYWDTAGWCLYINYDGATGWLQCCCGQPG